MRPKRSNRERGPSRRAFLKRGAMGLAALGVGALTLRADAEPTEASGELGAYAKYLKEAEAKTIQPAPPKPGKWAPTEDNILGPFYLERAPFRAKITPPMEPGDVLIVSGRVWGLDSRKPLAGATIDIWQADTKGEYSGFDMGRPQATTEFRNRSRLVTDERGYYEFETIQPGRYRIGFRQWRPRHIHYMVQAPGYRALVTQLYFEGDPHNASDPFVKRSLIIPLTKKTVAGRSFETGTFDIVLVPS
ncbi:twin-arginine translocation signal domain-containing protein [Nitrospinae bacterium AH_259_B05_G02_I21]|nr:twin-arginine translocation signal domain-containing protein [Nitrospinae bacterium AH_259_B05_G02_I21]MDA2932177.1 twin-arginine translocation signal domain-containing protein [Nitrospinae bacterium AH-259-F20]